MRTIAPERPTVLACAVAGLSSMLPWCALLLGVSTLLRFQWPSGDHSSVPSWWVFPSWWVWSVVNDLSFILPFLLFAGGVRIARVMGYSRRLLPTAAAFGLAVAAFSCYLAAWGAPALEERYWETQGPEVVDLHPFGAATPSGILRNLRSVEASQPAEYSLSVSEQTRAPPNVLRWYLHLPVAMAVFGLINTLAGVLANQLTENFRRGARRNVLLALGGLGGLAFFGAVVLAGPTEPFLQDGAMRSGILGAWIPLVVPLLLCTVLFGLARKRYV